jgi:argininosuccinate lyase
MAEPRADGGQSLSARLEDASSAALGSPLRYSDAQLATILSPKHFVAVRRTPGGPAPEETARAAVASRRLLEADEAWAGHATEGLADAQRQLAARAAAL